MSHDHEHNHEDRHDGSPRGGWWRSPSGIAFAFFAASAGYLLVTEHWAHIVPYLPFAILLLCPLMHVFHHGGHGGHGGHDHQSPEQ